MKKTTVRIFVCMLLYVLVACRVMLSQVCQLMIVKIMRYANSYGGNVVLEISNTGIAKATARAKGIQRRNSKNKCFYAIGTLNERSVGKNTDLEWFNKLY